MHFDWITLIGMTAAGCTTFSFIPQVVKALKTKKTQDLSFFMYAILSTGLFLWLIYGIFIRDLPVILANGVSLCLSLSLLILKLKHG